MTKVKKQKSEEQIAAEKQRKIFIFRALLWSIFSCVMPVLFIGWRYDLFKKVGSLQLSGWGLFAIVIVFVFLYVLVKYIKAGLVEWSMTKQVINGVTKVIIPLGVVLAVCVGIRNSLDYFIQVLGCTIIFETIAVPLNPFPKWVYEKTKGRFESVVDYIVDQKNKTKGE